MYSEKNLRQIEQDIHRLAEMETEHRKRFAALEAEILVQMLKPLERREPRVIATAANKVRRCPPMEWDPEDVHLSEEQMARLDSQSEQVNIVLTAADIAFLTAEAGLIPSEI